MAKKSGRLGTVDVSTDDITYFKIGSVFDISYDDGHQTEDATDFDSVGRVESDYGESQVSLSVSYHYDPADTGQTTVRTSNANKTKLYYRYRPEGNTSGTEQLKFQGKIDKLGRKNARNAKTDNSLDVVSSGAITAGTVP